MDATMLAEAAAIPSSFSTAEQNIACAPITALSNSLLLLTLSLEAPGLHFR